MAKRKSPEGLEGKSREEYIQLLRRIPITLHGKASRELHKKLKKYGEGLDFNRRYPDFSLWLAVVAFLVSVLTAIIRFIG